MNKLINNYLTKYSNNKKEILKYSLSIVCVLFSVIVAFILTENFNNHTIIGMDPMVIVLNISIYAFIFSIFYIIFVNVKIASIGLLLTSYIVALCNHYIFSFRGKPLLATDIYSINTALDVSGNYNYSFDQISIINTLFYLFAIIFIIILPTKKTIFALRNSIQRFLFTIYSVLFIFLFFFSSKIENWGMNIYYCEVNDAYLIYGSALTQVLSIREISPKKPEYYSIGEVERIISDYRNNPYSANSSISITPNIIVVIDEAFSDYSMFTDLSINEDPIPFLHSLKDNTISGSLYTSIWGGNTANTEYEFLTGNSIAFQPHDSVPFQSLHKKIPSLAYTLKNNNYIGIDAFHPAKASNWNRTLAYRHLGFENFFDINSFQGEKKLRDIYSDEAVYNKLLEDFQKFTKASNSPIFLYAMTIQNHSGYSKDYDDLDPVIIGTSNSYDKSVMNYFNLIRTTDSATKNFIEQIMNCEEPTLFIFFGDHQPKLSDEFYNTLPNNIPQLKYQVPFYIWANYSIEDMQDVNLSVNYLSSYILSLTGNKLTDYQGFLLKMHEEIPIINANIYMDKNGTIYNINDTTSPYYKLIEDYHILQYYNMYDSDNHFDNFFY